MCDSLATFAGTVRRISALGDVKTAIAAHNSTLNIHSIQYDFMRRDLETLASSIFKKEEARIPFQNAGFNAHLSHIVSKIE